LYNFDDKEVRVWATLQNLCKEAEMAKSTRESEVMNKE